jgi:hypothetical protein
VAGLLFVGWRPMTRLGPQLRLYGEVPQRAGRQALSWTAPGTGTTKSTYNPTGSLKTRTSTAATLAYAYDVGGIARRRSTLDVGRTGVQWQVGLGVNGLKGARGRVAGAPGRAPRRKATPLACRHDQRDARNIEARED